MKQHSDLVIFVIQRILVLIYCLAFLIHPILHSDFESSFVPVCRITLSGRSCGATIKEWYMLSVLAPCFFFFTLTTFYFDWICLLDNFHWQMLSNNKSLFIMWISWASFDSYYVAWNELLYSGIYRFSSFFLLSLFPKIQFYILFYRSIFIWIFWVYFFLLW